MIDFSLDEDQRIVQQTVRDFAREVVRPNARAWERAGAIPDEARRRFHALGVALVDVPEALGGAGAGQRTAVLVHEELAFGDAATAFALWAPSSVAAALVELASPEQARRLLEPFAAEAGALLRGAIAWSEPLGKTPLPLAGFSTVAAREGDGWRLTGAKSFVHNGGLADLTIVFAQVDAAKGWDGVAAFALGPDTAGVTARARHALLGLESAHVGGLTLDGARLPESARLDGKGPPHVALRRFLDKVALANAARQVGLARASYEYALEYTQERHAFGKPVAHFQAIAFTLADMLMDVESARWMLWRAAAAVDGDRDDASALVAAAAVHCDEAAWRVADHGVQLLGGAGFVQDHPVEKWLRDTKALALAAPPAELQRLTLAAAELGQPLPHDAALPSVALQPILS